MEDITEEFGLGLLQIASGAAVLFLLAAFLGKQGVFSEVVCQYMQGLCG